jgi:hypothetical protein
MKTKSRLWLITLTGVVLDLAAGIAAADVVYRWETIDAKVTTAPIVGQIVVSNEAWRTGMVDFVNVPCLGPGTCADPENAGNPVSPVRSLTFYMEGYQGRGVNLDYVNSDGDDGDGQASGVTASLGAALGPLGGIGTIFNAGSESYFDMTVDASGVWTVGRAMSQDWGEDVEVDGEIQICWNGRLCGGETGRWSLDRSTIPVPEPSTFALAVLALVGLRTQRRTR